MFPKYNKDQFISEGSAPERHLLSCFRQAKAGTGNLSAAHLSMLANGNKTSITIYKSLKWQRNCSNIDVELWKARIWEDKRQGMSYRWLWYMIQVNLLQPPLPFTCRTEKNLFNSGTHSVHHLHCQLLYPRMIAVGLEWTGSLIKTGPFLRLSHSVMLIFFIAKQELNRNFPSRKYFSAGNHSRFVVQVLLLAR